MHRKCRKLFILSFIFFSVSSVFGSQVDFFDHAILGDTNIEDYYGPIHPDYQYNYRRGEIEFKDSYPVINRDQFSRSLNSDLFSLEKFLEDELFDGLYCPISILGNNIEYVRYLFRLISISYLFESIKHHDMIAKKLDIDVPSCSVDWQVLLKSCKPTGSDMKTFLQRAVHLDSLRPSKVDRNHSYKNFQTSWLNDFNKKWRDDNFILPLTQSRLQYHCLKTAGANCKKMGLIDIKRSLGKICNDDIKIVKSICSETDQLYGLSQVSLAYQLLTQSNVMSVINQGGHAKSCIKRYVTVMKQKEKKFFQLPTIFDSTYVYLTKVLKSDYPQGRLFIPGALKEFDMKGLKATIYDIPTPTPVPSIPTPSPKAVAIVPMPTPTIAIVKEKIVPTPIPTVVPTVTPIPTVYISAFEKARIIFNELPAGSRSVDVNMNDLKDDFVFTSREIEKLKEPLNIYQTRQALKEMKQFDKLGSKQAPVRLLFLKYLIDLEKHKGLYNILGVLEDKFYLVNDIDKIPTPVYVELYNNEDTGWQWQIRIIEPKKGEE